MISRVSQHTRQLVDLELPLLVFGYKAEKGLALMVFLVVRMDLGRHSQLPIHLIGQVSDALLLPQGTRLGQ